MHEFALARFRFFSLLCLFCCILLTYIHAYPTAHPLLYPNSHECSYPNTIPIVTISLVFFSMHMLHKTSRSRSFGDPLPLFFLSFLPLGPYAPIGTAFHPSAPIYIIFWQTPENMMSGEISPAIAPKSWAETPSIPPSHRENEKSYLNVTSSNLNVAKSCLNVHHNGKVS